MEYQEFLQTEYDDFQQSLFFANESYFKDSEYLYKNPKTDTQFVFKKKDNCIYISFRGTESFKDVMIDTSISKQTIAYDNSTSPIRVHKGFYDAYLSVRQVVLDLVGKNYEFGDKFFISGHSLGGALALICALDIKYHFDFIDENELFVVTLGQPRVGNESFCNSTNRRLPNYFRFRNGNDIVPTFPKFGYEHCGKLIEIGDKKWYAPLSFEQHLSANYMRLLLK